ncbi:MAG: hypothetical protein M4579_000894 [Chaenotheca gracillima]|nr:MAG: hypothetical protein M4579_000894 [Chaenotheca gracillima]
MKQRFSSLDVKVIAHELSNSLSTLRLANIYDLSSRIFLLKFAKPDHREQLVIDSGFRCHLTTYNRATAAAPSAFVTRLRKYLRTRRVTGVSQIGTDRIIEIQFSEGQFRLYLEFYAGGNIVLTDGELNILAILRVVAPGTDQEELRVGLKYSLSNRQNFGGVPALTKQRIKEGLEKFVELDSREDAKSSKRSKKKAGDVLRKALAVSITEFPPMLVDHAFSVTKFDPTLRPEQILENDSLLEDLLSTLGEASRVVEEITSSTIAQGFIIAKPDRRSLQADKTGENNEVPAEQQKVLYDDFHPFRPKQFDDDSYSKILTFEGFNKTVDEFFSSIEGQKLEGRLQDREENAKRRMDSARQDHEKRIGALQVVQELNVRKAQAIEANVPRVEEAVAALNGLLHQGMDWVEVARLVEIEQSRHNPVAEMIKLPLKLDDNTATLLLGELEDQDDYEGDETDSDSSSENEEDDKPQKDTRPADKRLAIEIDLGLSPWANARQYYDQKRTAAVKEQKTVQSSTKALKSTEKKIESDLKKGLKQEKQVLRPVRRQLWFEKFMYFISSDGYLVLGGRDVQQNEMLYKRYLRRGDIYVHADLHGAATVIIKNNPSTPDAPIPPSTLSQAGNLSVASSKAWDSKAGMSAFWVNSDQVSKSAPTGEYLPTGSFMVRGKKNFLPPAQLLLGFAVMFQISEESKARHVKHRLREGDVDTKGDSKVASEARADAAMESEVTRHTENLTLDDKEGVKNNGDDAGNGKDGDDSDEEDEEDEDFPDAKLDSGSESDGDDVSDNGKNNPLQTARNGAFSEANAHESGGESDTDHDEGYETDGLADGASKVAEDATHSEAKGGVRHLSARERRLLRKGQQADTHPTSANGSDVTDGEDSHTEEPTATNLSTGQSTPSTQSKPNAASRVRGKRGKQKKLATKYANQTPEDRAAAMSLLGSAAAQQKASADAKSKEDREAEREFQKQRRREQHERAARETAEHEEVRRLMHEEGVETLDNAEEEEHTSALLDTFVGTPLPGDEILEAIPVCAPWAALGRYKYKVKLQPGSVKKGKAIREILGRWVSAGTGKASGKAVDDRSEDTERMWPREVELLKTWKDTEVLNTVPVSKVRVMMSGGMAGGDKAGGGAGGKGKGKGKGRGGKGSKKK